MPFITVPIRCCVEDLNADEIRATNIVLEKMGMPLKELPEPEIEVRDGEINTDHIVAYYPSNDNTKTIVECVNTEYSLQLPFDQFRLKINNSHLK